jgi:hypothetical protein
VYLADKNFLLISRKKTSLPASLNIKKNFNINKYIRHLDKESISKGNDKNSEKENTFNKDSINVNKDILNDLNEDSSQMEKCFSYRNRNKNSNNNNILLYNNHNLRYMKKNKNDNEDNELKEAITISNNLEKIINNRNNGKSRNNFSELSSLKTFLKNNATSTNDNYGTTVSIYNTPRCPEYKTFFKRTKKDKKRQK